MTARLVLALLLPFAAAALQWLLWDAFIKPYVWFLFFPAAFFSAWLGGLRGGIAGGLIGGLLVWYLYIPPQFSFALRDAAASASIALFVIMAGLFGWVFERLEQAMRRMADANAEITRLYRKTLELDELKSQFFANVSHELRTPLTLIMAPLEQRLGHPADAGLPAEARREDELMLRNARLLYRHVSDLLDAARLEAGGMKAAYGRVEFAELVRALAAHFDSVARERGIAYRVAAPPALAIEADGGMLQRILLNLLSNAFKFTPDGGAITVRLAPEGEMARLEVEDNGPGVPEAMREAVFERFRQVEGAADRRHGGTGLGLAIVREFAALHGGTAGVAAAPDGGALFAVRLPLKAPAGTPLHEAAGALDPAIERQALDELAPAAAPAADHRAAPDAPLVLVVEDNADMNAFIAAILRPRYRVASARDGRAGLAQALALAPDLILSDVMMPVMSGDALVTELRRRPEMAGVPIVMLTAKADDALRVKLLQAGVQDYLAKPFTAEELLARIDGLVAERRRTGEQLRESETRFVATFEQAAVGIALVAPDGRWLRVNRKLCAIVGYTSDELSARTFQDITHPDDLDADREFVRRMLARELDTYTMEKRYFRKDGGIVWINLTVALVWRPDGTPDYFISVIEDIDARKAAETALRESEEHFRALVMASSDVVYRMSPDWSEMRHLDGREFIVDTFEPSHNWLSTYIHPDDQPTLLAAIDRAIRSKGQFELEHRVIQANGSLGWTHSRAIPILDAQGEIVEWVGMASDITARRRAMDEIAARNAELERFDRAANGRELQMIALKREVNALARELGRAPPYDLAFADEPRGAGQP